MNQLSFFVSAPAWQIFSLMILPLIVATITAPIVESMIMMQFGIFIAICTTILWIYSVCNFINKKFSSNLAVPIRRLKFCLGYNFIYSIFFSFDFIPFDNVTLFHITYFGCNIYALYFLSKLLVMVEKRRKVNFKDWIGTFFAAYFLIFGIWFLQPRINRIFLVSSE